MLSMRERPRAPGTLPAPAPLPSLRDALGRRAAVFGPFDGEELPLTTHGLRQSLATVVRRVADLLDPQLCAWGRL